MKKFILTLTLFISLSVLGQEKIGCGYLQEGSWECSGLYTPPETAKADFLFKDHPVSVKSRILINEECADTILNLKELREINGGTRIKISYSDDRAPRGEEGAWTLDMKGAAEYACKIWEEALPPCLPINIKLKLSDNPGDAIATTELMATHSLRSDRLYPLSRNKACEMEYCNREAMNGRYHVSENRNSMFARPLDDITVYINRRYLSEISFSLGAPEVDKYDFVTIMLKAISQGLGFTRNFEYDVNTARFVRHAPAWLPFEALMTKGVSPENLQLSDFTGGSYTFEVPDWGNLRVSAPAAWDETSLNIWTPVPDRPITMLMADNIRKGGMIRDLSDPSLKWLIQKGLDWEYPVDGASRAGFVVLNGSTGNLIGFNESSLDISAFRTTGLHVTGAGIPINRVSADPRGQDALSVTSHYGRRIPQEGGITFSVLKKDGSWDVVYETADISQSTLNIDDFVYNYNDSVYDRSVDGHLRGRLTQAKVNNNMTVTMDVQFYVIEDIPQRPEIMFNGLAPEEPVSRKAAKDYYDPYARTVRLSFKNLEGTESMAYRRNDIGFGMSQTVDIEDFLKGYVDIDVDIDFDTEITLIAVNKNGVTRSETILIETLNLDDMYSIDLQGDELRIAKTYERDFGPRTIDYSLSAIDNSRQRGLGSEQVRQGQLDVEGDNISVSDLTPGLYVISLTDPRGRKQSYKFRKI